MKIFDETTNRHLSNITIFLERDEIIQLIGCLEELSLDATQSAHYHLNNNDFSKEITVALYDEEESQDKYDDKYKN